ncbi:MAG: hypothetical protein SVR81_09220, partial [Chloroflexota bacterium]|nr:hypothetical protein [Chloroflexota bacterium]
IKAEERQDNGETGKKGLLDGVPQAMPALLQADEIVERVGRVRFDQLTKMGDMAAIRETLKELEKANPETLAIRMGELLLGIASFAHAHEVGVEDALREALNRFRARFDRMESDALAEGKALVDLSDDEKAARWAAAGQTDNEDA